MPAESPCYYCESRECDVCIHGQADPDDVRKGLAMLADARKIAATFNDYGKACGIVAVQRYAREL